MSLLDRLRSYSPLGFSEPRGETESGSPSGAQERERIEPPEEVLGVPVEPAGVHLSEFDDPRTFDESNLDIHCWACGGVYPTYWEWYDHAGESDQFDTLDEAQDWVTILIPVNESIEHIMASGSPSGRSIELDIEGKPSPKDPGET
jgi:hypothetical protein